MSEPALESPARRGIARRLSFLDDRSLTLWTSLAIAAVRVDGPAHGGSR